MSTDRDPSASKKRRGSSLASSSSSSSSAPENGPIKRQKSEGDTATPTGDRYDNDVSVLQYKTRAMLVRLDEKNRSISHLRSRLTTQTQRQQHLERIIARVDAHWRAWQDDITLLIHGYIGIPTGTPSQTLPLPPLPTINSASHRCTATVSPFIELITSDSPSSSSSSDPNNIHVKLEPTDSSTSTSSSAYASSTSTSTPAFPTKVKKEKSSRTSASPPPPPINPEADSLDGKTQDELYAHIRQFLEDGTSLYDDEDDMTEADVDMNGDEPGASPSTSTSTSTSTSSSTAHIHVNGITEHQQESLAVDKALREKTAQTTSLLRLLIQQLKSSFSSSSSTSSSSDTSTPSDAFASTSASASTPALALSHPSSPSYLNTLTQLYVRHRHALHHLYSTRQQLISARAACDDSQNQLIDAQAELQRTHRKLDRLVRDLKSGKLAQLLGQAQAQAQIQTQTQNQAQTTASAAPSSTTTATPNHVTTTSSTSASIPPTSSSSSSSFSSFSSSSSSSTAPSSSPNASPIPADFSSSLSSSCGFPSASSSSGSSIPVYDPVRSAAAMAILDSVKDLSAPERAVERAAALYECAIEWRARAENRDEENEELKKEKMEITQRYNLLRTQASADEVVTQSAAYKRLETECATSKQETAFKQQQIEKLQKDLAELQLASEKNRDYFQTCDATRTARLRELEQNHNARVSDLQSQIVALTKERDEEKNRANRQGVYATSLVDQKNRLLNEFESTLKKQAAELKALKDEALFNRQLDQDTEYQEQIRQAKHLHYLYRRFRAKEKEWQDKEQAFLTQMQTVKEAALNALDITKVRLSEQKLAEENTQLKQQIAQLRQAQDTSLLDDLERVREESKTEHETSAALMAELDELSRSYEELSSQNSRLLQHASERDKTISQLYTERTKTATAQALMKTEREIMTKKLVEKETLTKTKESYVTQLEIANKSANEALTKTREQVKLLEQTLDPIKWRCTAQQQTITELQAQLAETKKTAEKANLQWREELARAEEFNTDIAKIRENFLVMQKQQAAAKKKQQQQQQLVKSAINESELEEELKFVKARLKCQVCSDRDKSVVITKCFHLFCRECIDTNIKTRHRKCPGCGIPFGADDVKPVYLT